MFSAYHPAIVLYIRDPTSSDTGKQRLDREQPKNADVPKSPFPTVAALVPSAGAITLQIELRSDAGAVSTPHPVCAPRGAGVVQRLGRRFIEYEWGSHTSLVFLALCFLSLWVAWLLSARVTEPKKATAPVTAPTS